MARYARELRWDLQCELGLDLNDWLRGDRDWQDLWDLKDQLPQGSKYRSAKLRDPDIVQALAQLPDPEQGPPPLEGFTPLVSRLANIEDLLLQLIYVTAHADASAAPSVPRPEIPHIAARAERDRNLKRAKSSRMEMQLIPGGVDA